MTLEYNVKLGPVPIAVSAETLPETLKEFFSAFPATGERGRIRLQFAAAGGTRDRKNGDRAYPINRATVRPGALELTDSASPIGYALSQTPDGQLEAQIDLGDQSRISSLRQRLRLLRPFNPLYYDADQRSLGIVDVLLHYIMQVLLSAEGASYVHASCVERDGQAVLFPAWGGVGKTSLLYRLVLREGYRFLADDMAILGQDGTVFMNPTRIAVYPYNLAGMPDVYARLMAAQSLGSRLHWHAFARLRGADGTARRVSPATLFGGDRIARQGRLARIFYLLRSTDHDFSVEDVDSGELADRATSVLLAEIRQFRYDLQAWKSVPEFQMLPYVWEIAERTRATLQKAFATVAPRQILIPKDAGPAAIGDFVAELLARG
jgi:hypothetical protein